MYTKSDVWDREREERDAKLREETKKELKELLTKYIGSERAKYAVNKAQHQMGVMIVRKSKAAKQMKDMNDDCKCFHTFWFLANLTTFLAYFKSLINKEICS